MLGERLVFGIIHGRGKLRVGRIAGLKYGHLLGT